MYGKRKRTKPIKYLKADCRIMAKDLLEFPNYLLISKYL